jgi:hypothetical protein
MFFNDDISIIGNLDVDNVGMYPLCWPHRQQPIEDQSVRYIFRIARYFRIAKTSSIGKPSCIAILMNTVRYAPCLPTQR